LNPHCKQGLASEKQVPSHYPGRNEISKSKEEIEKWSLKEPLKYTLQSVDFSRELRPIPRSMKRIHALDFNLGRNEIEKIAKFKAKVRSSTLRLLSLNPQPPRKGGERSKL